MTKKRTVIVTLEIETAAAMSTLKSRMAWADAVEIGIDEEAQVRQVTATVAQPSKPQKKGR